MSRKQWGHGYKTGLYDGISANLNFYDFCVLMHDGEDSPVGDFVFDMQRDKSFPKEIPKYNNWRTGRPYTSIRTAIKDHLHSGGIHACVEADAAFDLLWKEWKSLGR